MGFIKELTEDLVPLVDAYLQRDPIFNAYAIWDLHYQRHRTKFFICIEDGKLAGLLLDYFSHTDVDFIWLWGEKEVIKKLLDVPLPDKMVFHVVPELEDVIRQKFSITAKYSIDFMLLRKGQEHIRLQHQIKSLELEDAYSLASLRKEKPGEKEIKEAESFLKDQPFYGIFINSMLVSVACIQAKLPQIWVLGGFYTKPEYRNQGYATSLASFLVKEAFKETDHVGLHVRADNHPAKRVYEKVGFQVNKKMCWLVHNVDITP
jgi:GNAT superfamily N-acetyltransferase